MAIPGPPVMDAETAEQVRTLMAKGFAGTVFLTTDDCRASYEELKARGVEFIEAARGAAVRHRLRLPRPVRQPLPPDPGARPRLAVIRGAERLRWIGDERRRDPVRRAELRGSLRPYQRMAFDAFEADRAAGRNSTHLVAPPGSGKTVIGLEIVRRIGRPALVLAPTATIAEQWEEKLALFTDTPTAFSGPAGPLYVLTYQAVSQTADPGGALRAAAMEHLVAQRAKATGTSVESGAGRGRGVHGNRPRAHVTTRRPRAVARGGVCGVAR